MKSEVENVSRDEVGHEKRRQKSLEKHPNNLREIIFLQLCTSNFAHSI